VVRVSLSQYLSAVEDHLRVPVARGSDLRAHVRKKRTRISGEGLLRTQEVKRNESLE
jgi:hypothetical protein|tara:strand:- start:33020 stop:33190 length:171 start_codon:yes stop_codon:yes gene_type:complete